MAARSKARVCGRSPAEIVGSNPAEAHGCLSVVCVVLPGRGLCVELIPRPEKSYREWCVVVCDLETSRRRRPGTALGRRATRRKRKLAADRRGPDILQQLDSLYI